MRDILKILLPLLIAVIVPIAILYGRNCVKVARQGIIEGLIAVFNPARSGSDHISNDAIIPSFEFVKYKYYLQSKKGYKKEDDKISVYIIPVFLFMAVTFVGIVLAFSFVPSTLTMTSDLDRLIHSLFGYNLFTIGALHPTQDAAEAELIKHMENTLTAVTFAFVGSYVFVLRNLLKGISNFDISPLSFLRSTMTIISACVVAPIILRLFQGGIGILWDGSTASSNTEAAVALIDGLPPASILLAFCIGLVPDLGPVYVLRNLRLNFVKRYDKGIFSRSTITPVEVISGIDYESRYRLNDHNINDVQNLATANPIILFVETPYGIYEIIDWVAQAQLVCAVGAEKFFALRAIGVRTIFDLERAAGSKAQDRLVIAQVGQLLYSSDPEDTDEQLDFVKSMIAVMMDDLHVKRLRQIVNVIGEKLGDHDHLDRRDM